MDADVGDEFNYALSTTNVPFVLDGVSGQLRLSGTLDRERTDEYTMTVILTRTESPFSAFDDQAIIIVTVTDENDQNPVFNESMYLFSVPENLDPTISVGTVQAIDDDIGVNSQLTYSIEGSNSLLLIHFLARYFPTKLWTERRSLTINLQLLFVIMANQFSPLLPLLLLYYWT